MTGMNTVWLIIVALMIVIWAMSQAFNLPYKMQRASLFKKILEILLLILATSILIFVFGYFVGILMSLTSVLVGLVFSGYSWFKKFAASIHRRYAKSTMNSIQSWKWLDIFNYHPPMAHESITDFDELKGTINNLGLLSNDQRDNLLAAISMDGRTVEDLMIPVDLMIGIDHKESIGPLLLDELHRSGQTIFPVVKGDIDHIIGLFDISSAIDNHTKVKQVVDAMDSRVMFVGKNSRIKPILRKMIQNHQQSAIVVDGEKTIGQLSLESLITLILGKSQD